MAKDKQLEVGNSKKEGKIAVMREIEKTLAYRKKHVKCKGSRSLPSVPTAPKERKARIPGEGKSRVKKIDKVKKPVHCFFAERNKGCCYFCKKPGHKTYHCPLRDK